MPHKTLSIHDTREFLTQQLKNIKMIMDRKEHVGDISRGHAEYPYAILTDWVNTHDNPLDLKTIPFQKTYMNMKFVLKMTATDVKLVSRSIYIFVVAEFFLRNINIQHRLEHVTDEAKDHKEPERPAKDLVRLACACVESTKDEILKLYFSAIKERKDEDSLSLGEWLANYVEFITQENKSIAEGQFLKNILAFAYGMQKKLSGSELEKFQNKFIQLVHERAHTWAEHHGGWLNAFVNSRHSTLPIRTVMQMQRFIDQYLPYIVKPTSSIAHLSLLNRRFIERVRQALVSDDRLRKAISTEYIAGLQAKKVEVREEKRSRDLSVPDQSVFEQFVCNTWRRSKDTYQSVIDVLALAAYIDRNCKTVELREKLHETVIILFCRYGADEIAKKGGPDSLIKLGEWHGFTSSITAPASLFLRRVASCVSHSLGETVLALAETEQMSEMTLADHDECQGLTM